MATFKSSPPPDHSVDYSSYSKGTYTGNNRASRPVTTNYDNEDDERSPEYKKIMGQTDVTLTMSKYAKKDGDSLKVDGMIEEERRSKAYSKIIGQSSAQQLVRSHFQIITLETNSLPNVLVVTEDKLWHLTRVINKNICLNFFRLN